MLDMLKQLPKFIPFIVGVLILIGVTGYGGYYFGYDFGYEKGIAQADELLAQTVTDPTGNTAKADFSVFWEAWRKLKQLQVDAPKVSDQDLLYGAIKGLAGSFGDPHTIFFPPSDATKFQEDVSGSFGGIGANIGVDEDGYVVIETPLKGTPSESVGLKPADVVIKINGDSTEGLDVNEAVKRIRGPVGTVVTLTVARKGWTQTRDFKITRERITIPTLDLTMHADNTVGQIQLYSFNENAPSKFYEAIYGLVKGNVKGIILDMRNNPGGYLEVATDLAGWFMEDGKVIVSEQFRSGSDRVFRASGNAILKDLPVVVLVNNGSASAAEILAGALRDIRGVKLVGEHTYGKGTVQEVEELKDLSSLKITVAHWVLPSGKILGKDGLAPDYKVEITEDDVKNKRDPQLAKALEVLKAEITSHPPVVLELPDSVSFGGVSGQPIQILPAN